MELTVNKIYLSLLALYIVLSVLVVGQEKLSCKLSVSFTLWFISLVCGVDRMEVQSELLF